jgi:hypothetical protein
MLVIVLICSLPALARQDVAPGFSPARAALKGGATTVSSTPVKPFTQDQVQAMVRDGLGDESGAKLVEQRGIDFAPTEDFLQSLKAAGANEAFLAALRAAKRPQPAAPKKPLDQVQVISGAGCQEGITTVSAFLTPGFVLQVADCGLLQYIGLR